MPIRLVSFDVDDTLYDFTSLSRSAIEEVAALVRRSAGAPAAGLGVEEIISDLEIAADEMDHPYARIPELRRRAFARTLARFDLRDDALVEEMDRTYVRRRFMPTPVFAGARDVLERLARDYVLCVISNGEQDLAALGLDDLFDFILTATDAGVQKPDPRIFQAAMERAGCSASETAHVGDSVRSDVAGAKAAGAWAIWFNPTGRANPYAVAPDREVRALVELPETLKGLA
jgi:putative hydrolase of the HAD superfamily